MQGGSEKTREKNLNWETPGKHNSKDNELLKNPSQDHLLT